MYDRDFFKSNDIIGDATLDLELPFTDCALTKRPLSITRTYYNNYLKDKDFKVDYKDENSFWVPVKVLDAKTG